MSCTSATLTGIPLDCGNIGGVKNVWLNTIDKVTDISLNGEVDITGLDYYPSSWTNLNVQDGYALIDTFIQEPTIIADGDLDINKPLNVKIWNVTLDTYRYVIVPTENWNRDYLAEPTISIQSQNPILIDSVNENTTNGNNVNYLFSTQDPTVLEGTEIDNIEVSQSGSSGVIPSVEADYVESTWLNNVELVNWNSIDNILELSPVIGNLNVKYDQDSYLIFSDGNGVIYTARLPHENYQVLTSTAFSVQIIDIDSIAVISNFISIAQQISISQTSGINSKNYYTNISFKDISYLPGYSENIGGYVSLIESNVLDGLNAVINPEKPILLQLFNYDTMVEYNYISQKSNFVSTDENNYPNLNLVEIYLSASEILQIDTLRNTVDTLLYKIKNAVDKKYEVLSCDFTDRSLPGYDNGKISYGSVPTPFVYIYNSEFGVRAVCQNISTGEIITQDFLNRSNTGQSVVGEYEYNTVSNQIILNTGLSSPLYIGISTLSNFFFWTEIIQPNLTPPAKFKKYSFRKGNAFMNSVGVKDDKLGTHFVKTDINLQFNRMTPELRYEAEQIARANAYAIVLDNNGLYWFVGYDSYVSLATVNGATGSNMSDANAYILDLMSETKELPYEIIWSDTFQPSDILE